MTKNDFLKRFFEVIVGKPLNHAAEKYEHIHFEVSITPEVENKNPIVVFNGEHSIFPIIVELPLSETHLLLGFTDICFIEKTNKVRVGRKRREMLKLVNEFVRANQLLSDD